MKMAQGGFASYPGEEKSLLEKAMAFLQSSQGQNFMGAASTVPTAVLGTDPGSNMTPIADMASMGLKGVQMGSFLGPWGAVAGGAIGGLLGLGTGKHRQGIALQKERDAWDQMIEDKTVAPTMYPKGGVVIKSGAGAKGKSAMTEVQTEEGEVLLFPTLEMLKAKAKEKHSKMDSKDVTDLVPSGTFVFSNQTVYNPKSALDEVLAEGVPYFKEGHPNYPVEKIKMSDVLPDRKMTFAEAADIISKKIKVVNDNDDVVATMTDRENKATRMMYVARLAADQQKRRKGKDQEQEIPTMAEGGFIPSPYGPGMLGMANGINSGIAGAIGASEEFYGDVASTPAQYTSMSMLSNPKFAGVYLPMLERDLPDVFGKITMPEGNTGSSRAISTKDITPDDWRRMDRHINYLRNNQQFTGASDYAGGDQTVGGLPGGPIQPVKSGVSVLLPGQTPPVGVTAQNPATAGAAPAQGNGFASGIKLPKLPEDAQQPTNKLQDMISKYSDVYEQYLKDNEELFETGMADSEKLTRDLNFANASSGVTSAMTLLGQDSSVDSAYASGSFADEMFATAPQSQIDGVTDKLRSSRDNIVKDLINSGVPPGQAVTQAAGIIDRTMAQEGDVRTKFVEQQQQLSRQRYAFLNKIRDYNTKVDADRTNAERDNRNKVVAGMGAAVQSVINNDAAIRKADVDRRRQLMR